MPVGTAVVRELRKYARHSSCLRARVVTDDKPSEIRGSFSRSTGYRTRTQTQLSTYENRRIQVIPLIQRFSARRARLPACCKFSRACGFTGSTQGDEDGVGF